MKKISATFWYGLLTLLVVMVIVGLMRAGTAPRAVYYYHCRMLHDTLATDIQIHVFTNPNLQFYDTVRTKEGDSIVVLTPAKLYRHE